MSRTSGKPEDGIMETSPIFRIPGGNNQSLGTKVGRGGDATHYNLSTFYRAQKNPERRSGSLASGWDGVGMLEFELAAELLVKTLEATQALGGFHH